jgi:transcriptional regulator with XRE-family HTH domain
MHPVAELRWWTGLTQAQLAAAASTSQPTVAAYESDAKSPTLRTIRRLASCVGREAVVSFVPPLTREDRRSLDLHRLVAARLRERPDDVVSRARRNVAHMSRLNPGARRLLNEWRRAFDGPVEDLLDLLVDPRPRARELRHVSPFAGVLSPAERWSVHRRSTDPT